jgi:hypothetical protein
MHFPAVRYPEAAEPGFRNGTALSLTLAQDLPFEPQEGMLVRLYCDAGFIGLGRIQKDSTGGDTVRIHCMLT